MARGEGRETQARLLSVESGFHFYFLGAKLRAIGALGDCRVPLKGGSAGISHGEQGVSRRYLLLVPVGASRRAFNFLE
jgi:hypothetical protein